MSQEQTPSDRRQALFRTRLAFAAGCVIAAAGAYGVADLRAQTGGVILVCVAEDGAMRLPEPSPTCQAGQKSLYLFSDFAGSQQDPSNGSDAVARQRRVAQLERQIANLEKSTGPKHFGNTVVAPFTVVDRDGGRVFRVTHSGNLAYASAGTGSAAVSLMVDDQGGELEVGGLSVGRSGFNDSGFEIRTSEGKGVELGLDDSGNYALQARGKGGRLVAALGQAAVGSGLAFVSDSLGVEKASMRVFSDGAAIRRGAFDVLNKSSTVVARLTQGDSGGGLMTLTNSFGLQMVEAGSSADGYGVVRAGPESFKSGFGVLGLPGSYITGKP
jgi:hypothetical protein